MRNELNMSLSYANARHLKDTNWQMTMTWTEQRERERVTKKRCVFEDKIHRAMRWKLTKCLSSLLTNDVKRKRASEHRPFSSIKELRRLRRRRRKKITFRMHVITRQFFSPPSTEMRKTESGPTIRGSDGEGGHVNFLFEIMAFDDGHQRWRPKEKNTQNQQKI